MQTLTFSIFSEIKSSTSPSQLLFIYGYSETHYKSVQPRLSIILPYNLWYLFRNQSFSLIKFYLFFLSHEQIFLSACDLYYNNFNLISLDLNVLVHQIALG